MRRRALTVLLTAAGAVWGGPLGAQNSVFAVVGSGFPGRPLAASARGLGGGTAAFDPLSAVNPAAVGAIGTLTATATTGTSFRSYEAGGLEARGLQETRFPLAMVAGTVPNTPITFAASVSSYAERTFEFTTVDTIVLRGVPIEVTDRIGSDGGIVDARGALAWQVSPRLAFGVAAHLLTGSARLTANREFSDSAYLAIDQRNDVEFSAFGFSGGVVFTPGPRIRLAAAFRRDGTLDERVDSVVARTVELPLTLTGGMLLAPTAALRWSLTATWREWSSAAAAVAPSGAFAFDTWEVGTGIQLGGRDIGVASLPLRLGFRYAQLPFSPRDEQPREIGLSIGSGLPFAGNRAVVDLSLERILRDGAGMRERAWHVEVSILLRP